jgi:hypothetical protein
MFWIRRGITVTARVEGDETFTRRNIHKRHVFRYTR